MTKDKIKSIFSRFENLNLITLMVDLEKNLVACMAWQDANKRICPVAHGWPRFVNEDQRCDLKLSLAGLDRELASNFIGWWDRWLHLNWSILHEACKEILQERLDDADAVQDVITKGDVCAVKDADETPTSCSPLEVLQTQSICA